MAHGFSTRHGGHSTGAYRSLNLGLHVGDDSPAVQQNRREFIALLMDKNPRSSNNGAMAERLAVAAQVHGHSVARVDGGDAGRGALAVETAVPGADALVAAVPSLPLMLFYADCVPILVADPVTRAFCIIHAGWKGTASLDAWVWPP